MLQGKVHMAQFSVEIRHPVGSVLAEKQHYCRRKSLALRNSPSTWAVPAGRLLEPPAIAGFCPAEDLRC
jgi:hypothetical protein